MPSQAQAARRTQTERRAATRTKLLEATIQSLLDVGYAATTTRRVVELAGVSQGAMTHHFPYRVDLVGASVEYLAERRIADLRRRAGALPDDPARRLPELLDLLWGDFSSDFFAVFVKLWVAAADESGLYERLVPIERQVARAVVVASQELMGDLAADPGWEPRMAVALGAMRGLALTEWFEPRGHRRRDPWPAMRTALLEAAGV